MLTLAMIVSMLAVLPFDVAAKITAVTATENWGESGVYEIDSKEDMIAFAANCIGDTANWTYAEGNFYYGKTVKLTADIDMTGVTNWTPLPCFYGTFDGQGYSITGLINTYASNNAAAFIKILGGTIKNVSFLDCSAEVSDGDHIGAIVGHVLKSSNFENVYAKATVTATTSSLYVGGLVGRASAAIAFKNCVSECTVNGTAYCGGFVGWTKDSVTMIDCVFNGSVATGNGDEYCAGFVGKVEGNVALTRCINMGYTPKNKTKSAGMLFLYGADHGSSEHSPKSVVLVDCYSLANQSAQVYPIGEHFAAKFSCFRIEVNYTGNNASTVVVQEGCVSSQRTDTLPQLAAQISALVRTLADTTANGTTVNLTKDTFADYGAFTNWVLMGDAIAYNETTYLPVMMPATVARLLGKCPISENFNYQRSVTENSNGTINVRFVAVIDDLRYANVGFNIQITRTDKDDRSTTSAMIPVTVTTVYESINAAGGTVTAEELGGKYIVAVVIENIDYANYKHEFHVSAFVTMQDGTVLETNAQDITLLQKYYGYLDAYQLICSEKSDSQYTGRVLQEALSNASGKDVMAKIDTNTDNSSATKEILLGVTNREASINAQSLLKTDEFSITVSENKIVIVGEDALALDRAVEYFIEHCIYGVSSISMLSNYREQRRDESIALSELDEFAYTEPTSIYAGRIQQDFAIDFATGDIYYSTLGFYHDSVICRVMPDGHQEYMIINNFGHVETMEIERVGDKVYIWTTSQGYNDNKYNYSISRFEFLPGTTVENKAGQTFELKNGNYNYPCIDLENRYVGNWTGTDMYIYDMDRLLANEDALITVVNVDFPFEYDTRIGCGFDISGSHLYGGFYCKKGEEEGLYAIEYDLHGNVTNWSLIDYRPNGSENYLELNGVKVERINGVNHLFVGICTFNHVNKSYCPAISYFGVQKLDTIAPTLESVPMIEFMTYEKLPQNAEGSAWSCSNGIFSVQSANEQRLVFNETAFTGEKYSFQTTVTMSDADYAGIVLATGTNVSIAEDLVGNAVKQFIGIKITVSGDGVLTVSAYGETSTYNLSVKDSFSIKGSVSTTGVLSIEVDGSLLANIQHPNDYIGGHVGCIAKNGTVSFSDVILIYY